jgi:hypothetical protein
VVIPASPAGNFKLDLADILDLRAYEAEREQFRRAVIALKKTRRVSIGPLVTVLFENRTTILFQIQEMARAEVMVSDSAIQAELDVYNPLIPLPRELSLTLFIELTTAEELATWLPRLVGIERSLELRIGEGDHESVSPGVLDAAHAAQLTRDEVTSSVHYVRFALSEAEAERFLVGPVAIAICHDAYHHSSLLSAETRASLAADWALPT